MTKALICFDIQRSGQNFITEACRNDNGDVIDVVNLDEEYPKGEIEVINTHGLKKAVANKRIVVKTGESC